MVEVLGECWAIRPLGFQGAAITGNHAYNQRDILQSATEIRTLIIIIIHTELG